MTKAICWKCGVFKTGSFIPCPNCNADPITEDERLISLFLTDHYHDEAALNALHVQIRSGGKKYQISDELREEMRPALAAVSRMLGDDIKNDPVANQNQEPIKPVANRLVINLIRIALLVFVSPFVSIFVWSIYGNITLFADQLIPFGKIFGQSFYFIVDFIGGIIFAYCMFWTAFKLGPKKSLEGILFPISAFIIDAYLPQIRFSFLELANFSYLYAAFAGALLVIFSAWTSKLKVLAPVEILRRRKSLQRKESDKQVENLSKEEAIVNNKGLINSGIDNRENETAQRLVLQSIDKYVAGDIDGSLQDAENGLALDKRLVVANFIIGFVKHAKEDYQGAKEALDIAINSGIELSDKFYYDAYAYRGFCKNAFEDSEGAAEDFSKALEIIPDEIQIIRARGEARFELKDYSGSSKDLEVVYKSFPDDIDNLHRLSYCKFVTLDYEGAIEIYYKLLDLDKEREVLTLSNLSKAFYNLDNFDEALEYIDKARRLDPNNRKILAEFHKIRKKHFKDWNDKMSEEEDS